MFGRGLKIPKGRNLIKKVVQLNIVARVNSQIKAHRFFGHTLLWVIRAQPPPLLRRHRSVTREWPNRYTCFQKQVDFF